MKNTPLSLIDMSALAMSFTVYGQVSPFAKPEDAIKYRKAAFSATAGTCKSCHDDCKAKETLIYSGKPS